MAHESADGGPLGIVRNRRAALGIVGGGVLVAAGCASSAVDVPATEPATGAPSPTPSPTTPSAPASMKIGPDGRPFTVETLTAFDEPWAMAFLPDGNLLVSQRSGTLVLRNQATGAVTTVAGTPPVVHVGQGGLSDIVLGPTYDTDRQVYLSWDEAGPSQTSGAALGRATLVTDGATPRLEGLEVIWRQDPKVTGNGQYAGRVAFSPDGSYLFVSSGERQKFTPAQDLSNNLGCVLRLTPDGQAAPGNPFADRGGVSTQIWSYGHRNPLGLRFDAAGNLWETEMGPKGGDEVNLILPGRNYGWPNVSNGSNYDGSDIPDHSPGDGYEAPKVWWNPSISPGGLMIYTGSTFAGWTGDALVPALSGQALIRVHLDGLSATKADQWDMGARIRAAEQGPDGTVWLLVDGAGGHLLHLRPVE